jgi:hypothetical protein
MSEELKLTDEIWAILLELSQTNDYEFPYRVPQLCDRAAKVIHRLRKGLNEQLDGDIQRIVRSVNGA